MIKEVLQMVTDALNDTGYGVNTHWDKIEGSQAPYITAYDETRDDRAAFGRLAEPLPSLTVQLSGEATLQGDVNTSIRNGVSIPVGITYLARNTDSSEGTAHVWDTIRAVQYCLREWFRNENEADRLVDNIWVESCEEMVLIPADVTPNDSIVVGGLVCVLFVREQVGS